MKSVTSTFFDEEEIEPPLGKKAGPEGTLPSRVRSYERIVEKKSHILARLFGYTSQPSKEAYDRWASNVCAGDKLADTMVEWINEDKQGQRRSLLFSALDHGVDTNTPKYISDFFEAIEPTPYWVDTDLLDLGSKVIHRWGSLAGDVLRDVALMGGYLLSGVNHALILAGGLDKDPGSRISETAKWWVACTEQGGMERFGDGFKATIRVRLVHGMIRKNLLENKAWDYQRHGLPINQTDMAATNLAFSAVLILAVRLLGVSVTSQESKAVMHLWKYIGWLMGVDEKLLFDTEKSGLLGLQESLWTQSAPDWTSMQLARSLSLEPMSRRFEWSDRYPSLHSARIMFDYHKSLSVTSYFLSRRQFKNLGLPSGVTPWYPVIFIPFRVVMSVLVRVIPKFRSFMEAKGRLSQISKMGLVTKSVEIKNY